VSVLFLFLDGVGLAPATADNPLADAPMPHTHALLGGALTCEQVQAHPGLLLKPLDVTFGVEGLPQSGTGHVALLAGVPAPRLHGRHQTSFPPVGLRPLLAEQSIFRRAQAHGGRVAFANAFGPGYAAAVAARRIRRSASVIAAEGAGVRLRTIEDLQHGQALAWDITGAAYRQRGEAAPPIEPGAAGRALADLLHTHDLVFFECFLPDLAGHGRWPADIEDLAGLEPAHAVLARIDGLLGGILATLRPQDTLLLTSDHGNLESRSEHIHTLNPVPLLLIGPGAAAFNAVQDIGGIADALDLMHS
jgi:hypothetical protein